MVAHVGEILFTVYLSVSASFVVGTVEKRQIRAIQARYKEELKADFINLKKEVEQWPEESQLRLQSNALLKRW